MMEPPMPPLSFHSITPEATDLALGDCISSPSPNWASMERQLQNRGKQVQPGLRQLDRAMAAAH